MAATLTQKPKPPQHLRDVSPTLAEAIDQADKHDRRLKEITAVLVAQAPQGVQMPRNPTEKQKSMFEKLRLLLRPVPPPPPPPDGTTLAELQAERDLLAAVIPKQAQIRRALASEAVAAFYAQHAEEHRALVRTIVDCAENLRNAIHAEEKYVACFDCDVLERRWIFPGVKWAAAPLIPRAIGNARIAELRRDNANRLK
jgi:hypothetical protein